jgi:hypothetical protein
MSMHALLPGLAAATIAVLTANAAAPAWQAELSPSALGKHPRLSPVALDFQLSWKGALNSGVVTLEFGPRNANKPGAFVVKSSAESQGLAATLFPYEHQFWSELQQDTLRPRLFYAVETDAKETTTTTNRYLADKVDSTETNKLHKNGQTSTTRQPFAFAPAHDLFSAMLFVRSQALAAGDKLALVVMPFKTPYLLRVQVLGREAHLDQPAIKLSVAMQKIDRTTLELKPYKKLNRNATFWLTDDADRIPLELRADVFIGDVRATLTGKRKL